MASISVIEINTDQLNTDIKRLQNQLSQTRSHITRLKSQMDSMNSMWQGAANQTMQQRFRQDHDRMQNLCRMLEELIRVLESIRQAYDRCEGDVRDVVNALRV